MARRRPKLGPIRHIAAAAKTRTRSLLFAVFVAGCVLVALTYVPLPPQLCGPSRDGCNMVLVLLQTHHWRGQPAQRTTQTGQAGPATMALGLNYLVKQAPYLLLRWIRTVLQALFVLSMSLPRLMRFW